jgi:hypothetical protein
VVTPSAAIDISATMHMAVAPTDCGPEPVIRRRLREIKQIQITA